ncbi:hypothetical protein MB27_09015 [Actinoplanes utahensis]|uniref:Penicillin amidase n=1 Tax=Actinoplanes utahensis TaxID=1869 RepID=A0A0A6XCX4_ACTUT|nr:hypothetical protein MB27_09015 [Actinoplanes utahensis]
MPGRRLPAAAVLFLLAALPWVATPAAASGADRPHAVVRYTEYGVPHILAADHRGLGYGYGYAVARDNICILADSYVTVSAQRSLFHGPAAPTRSDFGRVTTALNSDLYFQNLNDSGVVERLMSLPAPLGPEREVTDMVRGYVTGYNRYLRDTGVDALTDPACRGADWVRPITELDVFRAMHAFVIGSGSGSVIDGLVTPQPPAGPVPPTATPAVSAEQARTVRDSGADRGSNAVAAGRDGTSGARSVLLGNPHYGWSGVARFWQSQLTIPGRLNVSGAGLLGFPAVLIGHNRDVAWSHTVSTPTTYGLFELTTDPADPTRYLRDGVSTPMTSRTVTVRAKQADGSVTPVSRTLWSTELGPVIGAIPGVTLPWGATVHVFRDANAGNLRMLNTWFGFGAARSTSEVDQVLRRTQGVPWLNTVASDRAGNAYYSGIQVVPHVTDERLAACSTALGQQLFRINGTPVLDGSRAACAWGTDPDAVESGLFGPSRLPTLTRADYVANANDSAWLTNPAQPLTGYPAVLGAAGTQRSARTQQTIVSAQRRLAGADGLPGAGFSLDTMSRVLFSDDSRVAELTAADAAAMCAAFPDGVAAGAAGPVDVTEACPVLAAWDRSFRLDSRGSLLFARFATRLGAVPGGPWATPFDPADPIGTPAGLATAKPAVQRAFADAVAELRSAGIALDAPLGDHQSVTRAGETIPVHGAPHALGVLNVITPTWRAGAGNVDVVHGSSFIQVVEFGATGAPRARTLLTYSQSADPTSPHHADQTRLFSRSTWVTSRFTEREIAASPVLSQIRLTERAPR